jgi:uncharacterized protein (DUF1697 family)
VARQIALLRGINLGAHNRIAMPGLREALTGLGYGDVRTLVASGNVVLTSRLSPARLERDLQRQIADAFGVDVPVVVRTRDELAAVIDANPFADVMDEPKRLQVTFLGAEAPDELVAKAEGVAAGGERVAARGREIYATPTGSRTPSWRPCSRARSSASPAPRATGTP